MIERALADLSQGTSLTLAITLWDISAFNQDYPAAGRVADLIASPSREAGVRAVGYGFKGLLSIAQGQWDRAMQAFDSAQQMDRAVGLSYRAYFLVAPFRTPPTDLESIRSSLAFITHSATPPPPNTGIFFTIHNELVDQTRLYLRGLYAAMANDFGPAARAAEELEALPGNSNQLTLAHDLALGVRSEIAFRQGNPALALEHLEGRKEQTNYLLSTSHLYAGLRENYRMGELLEQSGRHEEALRTFAGLENQTNINPSYIAPSLLWRARISERIGQPDSAALYYSRALAIWRNADAEFQPMVDEARAGLARVSGER